MIAARIIEVLMAAAPTLFAASIACVFLSGIAWMIDRRAVLDERARAERWHDAGVAIDDILAETWPEAAAVTGPIEVVITGEIELPPATVSCPHLSMLDRADGLRCPECDPR